MDGTTKIVPAAAALTKDTNDPHFVQKSVNSETKEQVNYTWRVKLGWTKESMATFLRREFRIVDEKVIESTAAAYAPSGNIRAAIGQVEEECPSVANNTTANSGLDI